MFNQLIMLLKSKSQSCGIGVSSSTSLSQGERTDASSVCRSIVKVAARVEGAPHLPDAQLAGQLPAVRPHVSPQAYVFVNEVPSMHGPCGPGGICTHVTALALWDFQRSSLWLAHNFPGRCFVNLLGRIVLAQFALLEGGLKNTGRVSRSLRKEELPSTIDGKRVPRQLISVGIRYWLESFQ